MRGDMEKMDRRKFIRVSAFFGIAGVLTGFPLWKDHRSRRTLMVITADPQKDLIKLRRLGRQYDLLNPMVMKHPVQLSRQDITIVVDGTVQDPAEKGVDPVLYEFSLELKSRIRPGTTLITLEEAPLQRKEVLFQNNGKIVESIPLSRNYQCIDIPGKLGNTQFRINNGGISVVHSSCRNRLCEKMGESRRGKIVCAPNRITASMPEHLSRYDALTG
jgi:hypothetical protein